MLADKIAKKIEEKTQSSKIKKKLDIGSPLTDVFCCFTFIENIMS